MKKKIFLYLLIILLSTVLLSGCTKKEEDVVEDEGQDTTQEEENTEDSPEDEDLGYLSNPEEFTKVKQSLGESSDFEYTIESIESVKKEGYQEFLFDMSSSEEDVVTPLFVVEPLLDKGVLRVTIKNIFEDNTGITHSEGIKIDTGAITGIYRVITSLENTRIYDIGILANNPFKLELKENDTNNWTFSVKVAYDTKYTAPTVDYGSTEFSSDAQSIEGMTSEEGAKITTYSYSTSGGILKFMLAVASGASNPIPSVNAQYDEEGMLIVTFDSLESDKVPTWGSSISLPSGVTAFVSRSGESSVYKFGGISGKKPFKLSATQSPNQVLVEITL